MFDQILNLVKEHLANNPEIAAAIPAEHQDAVHNEIANHLANTIAAQPAQTGGGILSSIESAMAGGGNITNAIEGGLVGSLASKFGLPPSITGAISGMLPGLMQKFANKPAGA